MVMGEFLGREGELSQLGALLHGRGPAVTVVRGREGVGTSALVARALGDSAYRSYVAAPLTDADHRALLAHRLAARSRLPALLAAFWARIRGHALPLHLVLVGSDPAALGELSAEGAPLAETIVLDLELGPLPYREVTAPLRGWPARDRVVAWAALGGMPSVVRRLEPAQGLAANLRAIVLDADAPFLHAGTDMLRRAVQSPARYASILMALGHGRREWGDIARAVPDFGSSGQLAPYLVRLEELRLVEPRRSLDAREGSRSR